MKKILTVFLAMTAFTSLFACWFSQTNINKAYIAGVNFFKPHYKEVTDFNNTTTITTNSDDDAWKNKLSFTNDIPVSLPLTVWFKVSPRKYFIKGESGSNQANISLSNLYYKIIPKVNEKYDYENDNYKWRLAKSVDMQGKPWRLDFSAPVKIFGNNTLTLKQIIANGDKINEGDKIILVWHIVDDKAVTNAEGVEIEAGQSKPYIVVDKTNQMGGTIFEYTDKSKNKYYGYYAPYVMSVIYNGKKTLGR